MEQKEKECFKCGRVLPLAHFYKHKAMADGFLNKCKECNKKDSKENYNRKIVNPEWKLKERDRSREKMRKARRAGKYIIVCPEQKKLSEEKYRETYPEKYAAHIASQRIPTKPCEVCGSIENIEKHHEDYFHPMDVTFLCRQHHYARHIEIRKQQLLNARQEKN